MTGRYQRHFNLVFAGSSDISPGKLRRVKCQGCESEVKIGLMTMTMEQ